MSLHHRPRLRHLLWKTLNVSASPSFCSRQTKPSYIFECLCIFEVVPGKAIEIIGTRLNVCHPMSLPASACTRTRTLETKLIIMNNIFFGTGTGTATVTIDSHTHTFISFFPRHSPLRLWQSEEGFPICKRKSLYLHEEWGVSLWKSSLWIYFTTSRTSVIIWWSASWWTRERSDLLFLRNAALSSHLHLPVRTYVSSEKWFILFELSIVSAFTFTSASASLILLIGIYLRRRLSKSIFIIWTIYLL